MRFLLKYLSKTYEKAYEKVDEYCPLSNRFRTSNNAQSQIKPSAMPVKRTGDLMLASHIIGKTFKNGTTF